MLFEEEPNTFQSKDACREKEGAGEIAEASLREGAMNKQSLFHQRFHNISLLMLVVLSVIDIG